MKHLEIKSEHFGWLLNNFKEWLDVLGYAETTVNALPLHIKELLHFLEAKHLTHITQVKSRHISEFANYLKGRSNLKYGGGLGASTINKTLQAVTIFARYLNQTGKHILDATPRRAVNDVDERTILTKEEVKQLYESTFLHHRENTIAMGQRDRAIIAIFYGCGLRKDEGSKLNITDIDLVRKLVFVRKGKGNKQRYVPIANKHAEDIKAYLEEGRNWFLEDHAQKYYYTKPRLKSSRNTSPEGGGREGVSGAFFINQQGQRMNAFYKRIEYMREKSGIEKHFSTHNLRHSIATHLLQSGMSIEDIAKFLGHSSLESTQIYTHIVNQLKQQKEDVELIRQ